MYATQLQTGHVVFQRVGQTVYEMEYANLKIPMNIAGTEKHLNDLSRAIIIHRSREGYEEGSTEWQKREFLYLQTERLLYRCKGRDINA
jgi:hypothetical protein